MKSSYQTTPIPEKMKGLEFLTLPETMNRLGHEGRRIDIFKVDCEACEWSCYQDWFRVDIRNLLVETHVTGPQGQSAGATFWQELLDHGFVPYSKEANTLPAAPQGLLFEWGFIRLHTDFLNRTTSNNATVGMT
uniref:Methyltransferase domain-containing protein n=1 Tax=Entomoneis paludosa TaxID=265537 RepID=A0A7S3DRN8_9STRA